MRFIPLLVTASLWAALGAAPVAWAEDASPDEAARQVHKALSTGTEAAYDVLIPDAATFGRILEAVIADASAEGKAEARKRLEKRGGVAAVHAAMRTKALARFARAHEAGVALVPWAHLKFVGLDHSRSRTRSQGGLSVREIRILVRMGKHFYGVGANDALLFEGRWYFTEGVSFSGRVGTDAESSAVNGQREALQRRLDEALAQIDIQRDQIRHMQADVDRIRTERHEELKRREVEREHEDRMDQERQQDGERREAELRAELERVEHEARMFIEDREARLREAQEAASRSQDDAMRMEMERDRLQAECDALRERLGVVEGEARAASWLRDAVKRAARHLAGPIVKALQDPSADVRHAAQTLALMGSLEAARPHFSSVARDAKADLTDRLLALGFLQENGGLEPVRGVLVDLLRSGALHADETHGHDLDRLKEWLGDLGASEAEIRAWSDEGSAVAAKGRDG